MGNEICCQQTTSLQRKQQMMLGHLSSHISHNSQEKQSVSHQQIQHLQNSLTEEVINTLNQLKPFEQQFKAQDSITVRKYGKDVYWGPIDIINRPIKIGKMYKQNGTLFIGNFISGKAEGPCVYIMKDGSYFQGKMKQNFAQCQNGMFVSHNFQYIGGFQDNVFHGKGREKSIPNHYTFEGIYDMGKKKSGTMKWIANQQQYIYQGPFDVEGKFTGKGKLSDPEGTYEGDFVNGQKHGFGIYYYKSQLRYQGGYKHNKKQGQGKLFNNDNTIAYKGVFKNGLPNGKGIATRKDGTQFETQWIDGIDSRLL